MSYRKFSSVSSLEKKFLFVWKGLSKDGTEPEREYRFCSNRRWRFDFAWVKEKVAVELEGGVYMQGRHQRAYGFIQDCEKYNEASLQGWLVLRFTAEHLDKNPKAVVNTVQMALNKRREREIDRCPYCGKGVEIFYESR